MKPRPEWFPDWTGETVAIVASGPSTKKVSYGLLKGRVKTIAIKENHEICPWADMVYGCDLPFWRNCQNLPKFTGLKVAHKSTTDTIKTIRIVEHEDRLLTAEPGLIGSGANSGFHALNMAVQFGAKRILLLGYDMSDTHGIHWFGRSQGDGRSQPGEWNFKRWRKAFAIASTQLHAMGIETLNASPLSSLTCFPIVTVEDALKKWGI